MKYYIGMCNHILPIAIPVSDSSCPEEGTELMKGQTEDRNNSFAAMCETATITRDLTESFNPSPTPPPPPP